MQGNDLGPVAVQATRQRFASMMAAWSAIHSDATSSTQANWREQMAAMKASQAVLVGRGDWVSGPADMMRLLGVSDLELKHSRMVGWLLTPTARHRLGDRILARLLAEGWPDRPTMTASGAMVELEVPVSATRADIVAYLPEGSLVVENKVWAAEGTYQCESLYEEWIGSRSDVRFLLLTRDGQPPASTRTRAAADAWRSISYRSLAALISEVLNTAGLDESTGRDVVKQYLETLRGMSLFGQHFQITTGGGHVDE